MRSIALITDDKRHRNEPEIFHVRPFRPATRGPEACRAVNSLIVRFQTSCCSRPLVSLGPPILPTRFSLFGAASERAIRLITRPLFGRRFPNGFHVNTAPSLSSPLARSTDDEKNLEKRGTEKNLARKIGFDLNAEDTSALLSAVVLRTLPMDFSFDLDFTR
jgi:hypothetical protein